MDKINIKDEITPTSTVRGSQRLSPTTTTTKKKYKNQPTIDKHHQRSSLIQIQLNTLTTIPFLIKCGASHCRAITCTCRTITSRYLKRD